MSRSRWWTKRHHKRTKIERALAKAKWRAQSAQLMRHDRYHLLKSKHEYWGYA